MGPEQYNRLESFVRKINEACLEAEPLLMDTDHWGCQDRWEYQIVDELLKKAKEYIRLEKKLIERAKGGPSKQDEATASYQSLVAYFTDLSTDKYAPLKSHFLKK